MHPNALIDMSCELLRAVLQLDTPADSVVSAFFRKHKGLGQRERHALAETAYTVLRQRPLLQHLAQSGSGPTERRLTLLAWQGNAAFLRGALNATELQWLEQVQALDKSSPGAQAAPQPARMAGPAPAGPPRREQFWQLAASMNEQAPLDLRVNSLKAKREEAQAVLAAAGIEAEPTPFSPLGLRIHGKPALSKLELFNSGGIEVQDEGSQLLALLLDAKPRRDGGGLLRRRWRQDAGAGCGDAQYRAALRF